MRIPSLALIMVTVFGSTLVHADEPSLRRMIGQMIIVGFLGSDAGHPWFKEVLGQIEKGEIGGVLYLQRNILSDDAVIEMNSEIYKAAENSLVPFVAIDQEGGKIERLTPAVNFPEIPSAQSVAKNLSPRDAFELYGKIADRLKRLGINTNLGPVVDLNVNPGNPIIGSLGRSFSDRPDVVTQYAAAFVEGHREHGIATSLKHFPGHGSSTEDSHKRVADISSTWSKSELIPFDNLIAQRYGDMIMVGHLYNNKIQKEKAPTPSTLSPSVYNYIRTGLSFNGIIITDDMQMDAIELPAAEAAFKAIKSGADVVILANDKEPILDLPSQIIDMVESAAQKDKKFARQILKSYERISLLKRIIFSELETDKTSTGSVKREWTVTPIYLDTLKRSTVLTVAAK